MRNFKLTLVFLLFLTNLLNNFVLADESMLTKKPYFTLRIETKNTKYLAKINGVVVFDDNRNGYMLNAELPVNYYMKTGENTISLNIFPKTGNEYESENISLSLYVNQDEAEESEKKLISNITFNGKDYEKGASISLSMPAMYLDSTQQMKKSDNGDVTVHKAKIKSGTLIANSLTISQSIELTTPFPRWGYLDGDAIDFPLSYEEYLESKESWDKKTINSLYSEYKKIYDLLATNDIDKVMDAFKERNREYDIAMYYPVGTYDKKLRKSFDIDLEKLKLKIRESNAGMPYISDDKKLLKLGSDTLIYFTNNDETSFTKYEIIFYKKDGKWIVSR